MTNSTKRIHWFAATTEITRAGPYKTQVEAWASLRRTNGNANELGDRVWCEEVSTPQADGLHELA